MTGLYPIGYVIPMTQTTAPAATEVRFTARRAARWCNGNRRWVTISQDTARELIALGAVDLTDKSWI